MQRKLGDISKLYGDRVYTTLKGIRKLVTWSQRRCLRCKRFLNKRQIKYCSKCKPIIRKENHTKRNSFRYHNDPEYRNKILGIMRDQYARNYN